MGVVRHAEPSIPSLQAHRHPTTHLHHPSDRTSPSSSPTSSWTRLTPCPTGPPWSSAPRGAAPRPSSASARYGHYANIKQVYRDGSDDPHRQVHASCLRARWTERSLSTNRSSEPGDRGQVDARRDAGACGAGGPALPQERPPEGLGPRHRGAVRFFFYLSSRMIDGGWGWSMMD